MKDEFYSVTFRKNIYTSLEALQIDVNEWLRMYNEFCPLRKILLWENPLQTFLDSKHIAIENSVISLWRNLTA